MTECSSCGAPLNSSSGGTSDVYRPGQGAQGYVPGGGQQPQPVQTSQPNLTPQQRPLGSLQRRLQRSQASVPDEFDDQGGDAWGDDRSGFRGERGRRSRSLDGPGEHSGSRGQRRPSNSGDGYGERGRRSHPSDNPPARRDARSSASGRPRDGWDSRDSRGSYDDSREEPAYAPDESREYVAWDASAEGPAYEPPRRHSPLERQERYRPMDESAEMSAEGPAYEPPRRPTPRRRSQPAGDQRGDWDDYTDPLEDPRSPLRGGRSGSQGRRPSQGGGRGPSRPQRRPADDYPGYTEGEMGAQGYPSPRGPHDAYNAPRYADQAPGGRSPRGWNAGYGAPNEPEDDYASREGWAAPSGYTHAPYSEYQAPPSGRGQRPAAFEESAEIWQPMAAPISAPPRSRRGSEKGAGAKPAQKRKGGAVRTALSLLTTLALVAALGIEFGPKAYHLIVSRGAGIASTPATVTCATETTPQIKPATGQTAFATSAYTLTYPAGWQKTTKSGSTQGQCDVVFQFGQPNGAAQLNVEEAGAFAPLTDLQVIQAEAQSAQQQGTTAFTEITSAATTQTIGGDVWQRREYQATLKNGVKVHLALLAGHHKGAGFAIAMFSSDTGFSSDDTTLFEPILRSFKFV